ncbi:MAG: DsbA family protein [Bryobacteraceae bacterium]
MTHRDLHEPLAMETGAIASSSLIGGLHRCLPALLLLGGFAAASLTAAETAPAAAAEVRVDVFSDFQCPYCAGLAQPIHQLQAKGVDGVRLAVSFKHFPLSFHSDAPLAPQAALAAGMQGKFWEMHDALFANQAALKRAHLLAHAAKLKLDIPRFTKDLDSEAVKKALEADKAEGAKRNVGGTPTLFVNGKSYSGAKTLEQLQQLVRGEQGRAVALAEITDGSMSKGPADARVTIEFYADLQSQVSRPALAVIEQAMLRNPGVIRLQFRNFPLAFHPQAPLAHEAAMTAARHGRFWEMAGYILDHQDTLREQELFAFAGLLGLNETEFAATVQARKYTPRVEADVANGLARGVRGSPVVYVNGKRIDGVPSSAALTELVNAELMANK